MADPTVTSHHAIAPSVSDDAASVSITLDGKEISVGAGQFLIAAAEDAGVFIPRFCYHPRLKPVGMCRMCLVDVTGPRGPTLQPACYVAVTDGMVVDTTSDRVKKAQDGVLEFLLVNHPLDCPVCDKGGECPLQDQTLAYGPGESRFIEEKRHFAKPISLSPLVLLDRERCIQCGRCTRFAAEIAGEAMIDFVGRGDNIEVAIAGGTHVFSSAFSGNTVQICPVGALTSTPYRFTARPWDLDQVESTCTTCAVGCRAAVQSSANRVTRLLGMDSDPVNQSWLCDKGRYGYESVNSENRLTQPYLRSSGGTLEASSWSVAVGAAADRLGSIKKEHGPEAIGVIGGARLSNEDAYAWAKLAKGVIGTDSVDAQLGDGLPAELVLGLPRASIDDTCSARCVIVLAGDLYDELPVLYLRLRSAAEYSGLPIIELSPRTTHLTPQAQATLETAPGTAAAMARALAGKSRPADVSGDAWDRAMAALGAAGDGGEGVVVVIGRGSVAESDSVVAEAAEALADAFPGARFLPALRRGNVMGALDMGLAPGLLPGRTTLEEARGWYESEGGWAGLPTSKGRDTSGVLQGLVDGTMKAVVLLGADPLSDFPDGDLARKALEAAELVIAVDCVRSSSVELAHVVLPAATHHERPGTTTNIEGRVIRVGQKLTPPVGCWPDWMVAVELAARLGSDLGVASAAQLWDEIEHLAPSHAGLTRGMLDSRGARDGVIVPLRASQVSIGSRVPGQSDGKTDPIGTPGIESVELQGAVSRVGFAEQQGGSNGSSEREDNRPNGSAKPAPTSRPKVLVRASGKAGGGSSSPSPEAASGSTSLLADGSLRLLASRRLYDHGSQMLESPSLAGLVGPLVANVNPSELETRGITAGTSVRLVSNRSDAASLELEVVADGGVMPGVVEVSANVHVDGDVHLSVSHLISAGELVTGIRMEQV